MAKMGQNFAKDEAFDCLIDLCHDECAWAGYDKSVTQCYAFNHDMHSTSIMISH